MAVITGASAQAQQPDQSQQSPKKQSVMMDTLDHKLDFSRYLIDMHGFIPWPSIISEPALGRLRAGHGAGIHQPEGECKGKSQL